MTLYACSYCGGEESPMPKVIMAVNTSDNIYPYYDTLFENKLDELVKQLVKDPYREGYGKAWEAFYLWLMNTQKLNFCSIECAISYLNKNPNGGIK